MGMATSERRRQLAWRATWLATAAVVAALGIVGLQSAPAASTHSAFGWLQASPTAPGWSSAPTRSGARLAYPPGWHLIHGDSGSASAAPVGPRGFFAGYLNATPQSGPETLANWRRFRVAHVADEGGRAVRLLAVGTGLAFNGGNGSCVVDAYTTTATRFREIACIVAGAHGTTVVVAATPAKHWAAAAPLLERAVKSFSS
jgi:hypothetical protein